MTPITRILAATDFSAPARHAMARAFQVAADIGARMELSHVLGQGPLEGLRRLLGMEAARVEAYILERARENLESLAREVGQPHGLDAGIHLAAGTVLRTLLEQADELDVGLVVVGAKGEDYLGRLLLGTTAERLLRRTTRPVLMVRQTPHEGYRRVLVPVDFSAWSIPSIQLARAVAPRAELLMIHAFEAPFESKLHYASVAESLIDRYHAATRREAQADLDALVLRAGLQAEQVSARVVHGPTSRVILAQEQERDCDLIVMGKHGQGVMEELLLGSVTKHILAEATSDVLVASARMREDG
ncbi:MAG TPA: universal stress protein [Thiobacillaceae bacterium]|nr:universal stress protein [Thiobacillaceae bacterium]HNU64345.1 universal stress protein [Thiobacillaceae bacterium]